MEASYKACFWSMVGIVVMFIIAILFCGCTKTEYITVEKVRTDTAYINKVQHDSICLHDSTFVKVAGDTVLIERWHTRWENHLSHDTIYRSRVDSVPVPYPVKEYVENPLGWWQITRIHVGDIVIFLLILWLGWKFLLPLQRKRFITKNKKEL